MARNLVVGRTITAPNPRVIQTKTVPDPPVYDEEPIDGELDMNGAVWGMLPSGIFRLRSGPTIPYINGRYETGLPIVNPVTGYMVPHHDVLLDLLDPDEFEDITDRTMPPRVTPTATIDVIEANNMYVDTTLNPRSFPRSGATESGGAKVIVVDSFVADNIPEGPSYPADASLANPLAIFPTMGVLEVLEVRALSGMQGITIGMFEETQSASGFGFGFGTAVPTISCALADFGDNMKVASLTYSWGLEYSENFELETPVYNKYTGQRVSGRPFRRIVACYGQGYPGQTNGRFDLTIRWTELPLSSLWDPNERGALLPGMTLDPSDFL